MKEKELQKAILEYLNKVGFYAWRNNTGAMKGSYKGKTRFVRFSPKGSGDIFAIIENGEFLSIEVKSKGKVPTLDQKNWMSTLFGYGATAVWVDSWENFEQFCSNRGWPI